jgi:hypothetical protein
MQRLTYVRSRGRVGRQQQPTRPLRLMAQRHGQHFRSREGQIAVCFTTNGSSTASRVLLAAWIARVAAIPLQYVCPWLCPCTPAAAFASVP